MDILAKLKRYIIVIAFIIGINVIYTRYVRAENNDFGSGYSAKQYKRIEAGFNKDKDIKFKKPQLGGADLKKLELIIDALSKQLKQQTDPGGQRKIAKSLGKMISSLDKPRQEKYIERIRLWLKDKQSHARRGAVNILRYVKARDEKTINVLVKCLSDKDKGVRDYAVFTLSDIADEKPGIMLKKFRDILQTNDFANKIAVCEVICHSIGFKKRIKELVPELKKQFNIDNYELAFASSRAIIGIIRGSNNALNQLKPFAGSNSRNVQYGVILALLQMKYQRNRDIKVMVNLFSDPEEQRQFLKQTEEIFSNHAITDPRTQAFLFIQTVQSCSQADKKFTRHNILSYLKEHVKKHSNVQDA